MPHFESWKFDWLDVPSLIRAAERCYEYPMVDRNPLERWTFGRVTLLGDAAHPMYPIGSNGASQAILDARVLAREIRAHGPTEAAMRAYESERRPATSAIVLANRKNGPEQVMQMVEERAPNGFARIEDVLSSEELQNAAAGYKRIAGFDKNALNNRAPIVAA
jgi:2-polyprenyl-6-methoxyphenol hydroxylase-like FAD-dependent oxidoreductase